MPQALTCFGHSPKLSEAENVRPRAHTDMEIFLETTKICERRCVRMALSPSTPRESESLIGGADTGARKRRKVEQAGQQGGNSAQVAVNGISKEDRKQAKKARRAASRAEIGANKAGSEKLSR